MNRNKNKWNAAAVLVLSVFACIRGADIVEPNFGYEVTLPENWVQDAASDTHHIFVDTSLAYPSFAALTRYRFDQSIFLSGHEWVECNFIAYLLSVEYSIFPWGVTVYFDSTGSRTKQGHWAPEAWSFFSTGDTTTDFSEFILFTEANGFGYEMYVMGDSADMAENIVFYIELLDSIKLLDEVSLARQGWGENPTADPVSDETLYYDIRGRGQKAAMRDYVRNRSVLFQSRRRSAVQAGE